MNASIIGEPIHSQYKFYTCKGNNAVMVQYIFEAKMVVELWRQKDENLNLFWTQWCKKHYIQDLPCFKGETSSKKKQKGINKISNHFENQFHFIQ